MTSYVQPPNEPIAIVGRGCRLPGSANSPSRLWELLFRPHDVSRRVPETRFNPDGFYHPDGEHHGASNVTKSYFLDEDPRLFDSAFFQITPREAEAIDPQQRLLLEAVFEAMESGGLDIKALQGSLTSAYVGIMTNDYTDTQARDTESFSQYQATGTSRALISNRLSYFFDWKGPSMTVDTACSSSLTAIHLAVQSLRTGESHVACVAGANLLLGPDLFIGATSLHMISPSGHCQMWDAGADGYARGEGIAAVFLKTLSQALKDGDRIEALIRETGVNSDGRTKGITLPSPEAQTQLIRDTYRRAGLDLREASHRPQYFEAHGTGTQAGDPREAAAIKAAFFPDEEQDSELLVGSIKTVIGHTEGCAGIAGVLKVSLAMQNKTVPPNQHLKSLNPTVAVSYANLRIPTEPVDWPSVPDGHPLRGSVNSFGFGGTNSHAILETYVPEVHDNGPWGYKEKDDRSEGAPLLPDALEDDFTALPLSLSANSDRALVAMGERYADLLRSPERLNLSHLAWTLLARRTVFPHRICFSGTSRKAILMDMEKKLSTFQDASSGTNGRRDVAEFGIRSGVVTSGAKILGVFTGQGAQWPQMGRSLILRSHRFRSTIAELERSLAALPNPPAWSLHDELVAPPTTSRLDEAALSQPLCTAVQVGLVNLLKDADITFHTVIGHSSGEIAAAYAAGRISAADSVRLAYYRGVHAKLAGGRNGQKGLMMAAGMGLDDARAFCNSPQMSGRLAVAASNSGGSVTLSGDEDAVLEAKMRLDGDGTFNRILKVDTAYHSHHMQPCADAYVASLEACQIQVLPANDQCRWVSSVLGDGRTAGDQELKGTYWRDNMAQTVLFSQALENALDPDSPFDLALECGPHPALRGPALQIIKGLINREIPYAGLLDRKKDDVLAFSEALGFAWTRLPPSSIDFTGLLSAMTVQSSTESGDLVPLHPLGNLPTYPWEHLGPLWRESRLNRQYRLRSQPPHQLLGVRTPDDTPHEPRWRNLLKLDELPWLLDHRIQGQIVVPGAAYIIMALEAARFLALELGKQVRLVDVQNLEIQRPIVLDEASEATETLFSLRETGVHKAEDGGDEEVILADFTLSASAVEDGNMRRVCRGELRVFTGPGQDSNPLPRAEPPEGLRPMSIDRFYAGLDEVGLNYSGPFRALNHVRRRMDFATGVLLVHDLADSLQVHPSWLDVCIQAMFAAFSAPGDGTLWTAFVPTSIRRVRFDLESLTDTSSQTYTVDAYLSEFRPASHPGATLPTITGDIDICGGSSDRVSIRIEHLSMTSLLPSKAAEDRQMFWKTVWMPEIGSGVVPLNKKAPIPCTSASEVAVSAACDIVAQDYLLRLGRSGRAPSRLLALLEGAEPASSFDVTSTKDEFRRSIDMQLVCAVGDALLTHIKGHDPGSALEKIESMRSEALSAGVGAYAQLARLIHVIGTISHRYPRMRVVQVGVDTNIHPLALAAKFGSDWESYTVVDSESALREFRDEPELMTKPQVKLLALDDDNGSLEILTGDGGLGPASVDLIIWCHRNTAATHLSNIRKLVRPGGYFITAQLVHDALPYTFVELALAALKAFSQTASDEEDILLCPVRWDKQLRENGFSGVDQAVYDIDAPARPSRALFVSQAIDELTQVLRSPLEAVDISNLRNSIGQNVLIIGGRSLKVTKLVSRLQSLLRTRGIDVQTMESLGSIETKRLSSVDAAICLQDLESPVLDRVDEKTWHNLQQLCGAVRSCLWVTSNDRDSTPYHSAMFGLGRTILSENPQLALQFIQVDLTDKSETARLLGESFLRLQMAELQEMRDGSHLWSTEPELAVVDGSLLIPRILPDPERNERLNANRRQIATQFNPGESCIRVVPAEHGLGLHAELVSPIQAVVQEPDGDDKVRLRIEYSTERPVCLPSGHQMYICIGRSESSKASRLIALTPENTSTVLVSRNHTLPATLAAGDEGRTLSLLMTSIEALKISGLIPQGHSAAVLGADASLAHVLQVISRDRDSSVHFVPETWMQQASTRRSSAGIPSSAALILNCSSVEIPVTGNPNLQRLTGGRPLINVQVTGQHSSMTPIGNTAPVDPIEMLTSALKLTQACLNSGFIQNQCHIVPLSEITMAPTGHSSAPLERRRIIDWTQDDQLYLLRHPVVAEGLFSPDKTYILFGLTGQMGQGIASWMVDHGARYIVAVSRNPDQNAGWVLSLRQRGAHVRVAAADITKKSEVRRLRDELLQADLPTTGGVVNGAMVLSDGIFGEMSLESLQRTMRPKVDGSRNIDEVFGRGKDLDFFLMLSSLSAVVGMPSQANYAAANMFMAGLARHRRMRGLPASVIDLGMMLGIGYISRSEGDDGNGTVETSLRKQNYMPVAERDLYAILTEAIIAGKYGSVDECGITTGLTSFDPDGETRPVWRNNPRFSHLTRTGRDASGQSKAAPEGEASLRGELAGVSSVDEAAEVISKYFSAYLAATLKLQASQVSLVVPVIDLGIDSLVAIEIRSWFSTETGHDVAVLKILGGATIQQLCSEAAASVPFSSRTTSSSEPIISEKGPGNATFSQPKGDLSGPQASISDLRSVPSSGESTSSGLRGNDINTPLTGTSSVADSDTAAGAKKESMLVRTAPLSLGQARFYYPSLYLEETSPFNCTTSYKFRGPLDTSRLAYALQKVAARHEILRTCFTIDKYTGKAIQSVLENSLFQLEIVPAHSDETSESTIAAVFHRIHNHTFDLAYGETLIASVITHTPKDHTLVFGYHHIVMDGVSWQTFLQDMADAYNGKSTDPPALQYIDFAAKQQATIETPPADYKARLDWWKAEFPTTPEPLPLFPFARTNSRSRTLTSYKTREVVAHIPAATVSQIRRAAQQVRATAFHFWLAAFQATLHRLLPASDSPSPTAARDLCIGVVDANRSDQAVARTVGFLLEIMPVKFRVSGSEDMNALVKDTRSRVYGTLGRGSGVPIEEIMRVCGLNGDKTAGTSATPLFQTVFNYRMGATRTPDLKGGVEMELLDYADATTPFDISVSVDEKDDGTGMVTFAVLESLYSAASAELLVGAYQHMLDVLSKDPSAAIDNVDPFAPQTVRKAIELGIGDSITADWPYKETISRRVTAWADADPDAVAVKDMSGAVMTYEQVSRRAAAIAHFLQQSGASAGSFVCVLAEPTVDTVCYILAILRLRAVYVPLDVRNADERLRDIVHESQAQFMLYQPATRARADKVRRDGMTAVLNLAAVAPLGKNNAPNIFDVSRPDELAFVLYTSGSTGQPKGIPLTNFNMAVQNASLTQRLGLGREVVLQQSGLGFDASICQIFMCLCNGGTLVIGENRGDPADLAALIEREKVTVTLIMVSEMAAMIQHAGHILRRCDHWRLATCGGEAFTPQLAKQFASLDLNGLVVANPYGPTEGSIIATVGDVDYRHIAVHGAEDSISVGQALPGYGVYVVDENNQALPAGVPGQVALAGPGVAPGYLHLPQLTGAKFRPDAISPNGPSEKGWGRIFLTGDKGSLSPDGRFQILGRLDGDSQIKLRGIRIELKDISHAILKNSNGKLVDAAVVARGEGASQFLVAFVVFATPAALQFDSEKDDDAQRVYLRKLIKDLPLPSYMRPTLAVPLESLPFTGRGKLDTKALEAMPLADTWSGLDGDDKDEEDLTETETRLKNVWKLVTAEAGVSMPIKKSSDFFSVGGNSLLLVQLRAAIRKAFGVDIPVVQLFQSSTLEVLAARLAGSVDVKEAIDWEDETRPDEDMVARIRQRGHDNHRPLHPKAAHHRPAVVILTGATGFLGKGLLNELVANPDIATIHCLAIRDNKQLSVSSPKLISHAGGLALPFLGLSGPEEARSIFAEADVIIHNGATVSHLKSYGSLRGPNLSSTQELVRMALTFGAAGKRLPAFHYISTGGVASLSGADSYPETSLASFPPPRDGSGGGYVSTKWASERFLERVSEVVAAEAKDDGWPILIHRPSSITSLNESAVPGSDITHNTLRYSRLLRAVPDLSQSRGAFDFINVETISRRIANDVVNSKLPLGEGAGVTYRHQRGEKVVPFDNLAAFLGETEEQPFRVLDMEAWVKLAVDAGMDQLVGSFLAATKGMIYMPVLE